MKKIPLLICVFLPFIITAQYNLKNIRHKSWKSMVFRISASDAEKYLLEDSIPIDRFMNEEAVYVFHKDSVNIDALSRGHYVLISVVEGKLIASIEEISDIIVYPANNEFNTQLNVRKKNGDFIDNAGVWINGVKTLLAYKVLEQDKNYEYLLEKIIQYFLEKRSEAYWTNTVESASIVSAILPKLLKDNPSFNNPASISVNGDSSFIINSFPFSATLPIFKTGQISLDKSGGGISYLTLYQKWWNYKPDEVTDKFDIETYFEKDGRKLNTIATGGKIKMKVRLNALKESDYVMIEVPIPAGCTYAEKLQDNAGIHKEFLKNKLVLFVEFLKKGEHVFDIELAPRYKGSFTLNPAKAELMYFPTFYGRNKIGRIDIE